MANIRWQHFTGISLLSMATRMLELALNPSAFSSHLGVTLGFWCVPPLLLGSGASGVVLALWTGLRQETSRDHASPLWW